MRTVAMARDSAEPETCGWVRFGVGLLIGLSRHCADGPRPVGSDPVVVTHQVPRNGRYTSEDNWSGEDRSEISKTPAQTEAEKPVESHALGVKTDSIRD